MIKNVGMVDRILRLVLGVFLVSLVFWGPQTPWGWVGVILIATAGISWCPIYRLLGTGTLRRPPQQQG